MKHDKINLPVLVDDFVKKTTSFNGGEIYWLFEPAPEIQEEWERRIVCALCFTKNFLRENGVVVPAIPYRVYMNSSYTETKSMLFEKSQGKFILQPNAASAVVKGALFAEQKTKMMDVHEYIHILMDNLQYAIPQKGNFNQPMWYREGLAQYIEGKKSGTNNFDLARQLAYLPPFTLKLMNVPTEKFWLEFGIMDYLLATGNHPGLTACASFVQFLIEKEGIGFKKIWELVNFQGDINDFYQEIAKLAGNSLFNVLNNYLYYVDKPFFSPEGKTWEMPVAVARDFRGEFTFENRSFEVLEDIFRD